MRCSTLASTLLCLFASSLGARYEDPAGAPPVVQQTFTSAPLIVVKTPSPPLRLALLTATSSRALNMKLIVVTGSTDENSYQAIVTFLGQIGVPYKAIVLSTIIPDNSGNRLSSVPFTDPATGNGLYQGIILSNSTLAVCKPTCTSLLSTSDWSTLDNYAIRYGVRIATYYTYPETRWGLAPADSGATYTASNPLSVTVTSAGTSIFSYLNGTNPIPVAGGNNSGIWAYRATPVAGTNETTTPLLAAGPYIVGVTHTTAAGEQSLSLTMDNYPTLLHSLAFNYGVINWVTQGVFLGSRQIYLSPQIDDFLLGNWLYAPTLPQCQQTNSCPTMFMTAPVLQALANWQSGVRQKPQFTGFRTSFAYNGIGYTWLPPDDPLFATIKSLSSQFGWVSHTWGHNNLDCFSVSHGICNPATYEQSLSELNQNIAIAPVLGITIDTPGLVTPFNSGLSNQDFLTAAVADAVRSIICPNYPPSPNSGIVSPWVPEILEVPRVYTNLFDDVESPQTGVPGSWTDEFNAMYGPNGTNPIFDRNLTYGEIIDRESDNILLLNVLTYQDYMMGFHIANTWAYDGTHSLYSDLVDAVISKYQALFNLPVVTLAMSQATPLMQVRASYDSSGVTGVFTPGVNVVLTTVKAATIPITGACAQISCASYGGQLQDNVAMTSNSTVVIPLSTGQPPALSSVSMNPSTVIGGDASTGTVILRGAAPTGGLSVGISSDNASASVPASVFVSGGSNIGTFSVTTTAVTSSVTANITASYDGLNEVTSLTITPPVALLSASINPVSITGGNPSTGSVTLSTAAPPGGIIVTLDSNSTSATVPTGVTVPSGAATAVFTVTTTAVTSPTTATITASLNGVNKTASVVITPVIALSSVSLNPGSVMGGNLSTGTVTLSAAATTGDISIALSSNSTLAKVPATVTVPAGSTSATFSVTTTAVTSTETVAITASYSGVDKTTSLTIIPAVALSSISLNPTSVTGGSMSTSTVTLSAAAPTGGISIALSSSSSSATVPPSVIVPTGSTASTFTITTKTVTASTTATITATYNSMNQVGTLTITPVPALSSLSLNPVSITGGSPSIGTVTLTAPAPAGGLWVGLWTSNSTYATAPPNVVVAAGNTTATFTVTTKAVTSSTTVTVSANYSSVTSTAALTLAPTLALSSVVLNPASVASGSTSTGTVTLNTAAPAGGVSIKLSSNNPSATVPASITVASGSSTAPFTVTTADVPSTSTATITATYNGVNRTASLTIVTGIALSSVSLNPSSVTGGNSSAGTVILNAAAPSGGISIALSSNSTSATLPATVTVMAGSTNATFTVATRSVTSLTTTTITAAYNGTNRTATLTIVSAPALVALSLNPTSVTGGSFSTGTVTLSAPAPTGGLWVGLWSDNSSATAPANVVAAAGATTATFNVTTKSVTSVVSAPINAIYNGVIQTAPLIITAK